MSKRLGIGKRLGHARALHVLFQPRGVEAELARNLERPILGDTAAGGKQSLVERKIFALRLCRQGNARHGLGIGAEHRQLLQHETYAWVLGDELFERRHVDAAIRAIVVEEGDDAHLAFRVAGDEGLRRAVDGVGIGGDRGFHPRLVEPLQGKSPERSERDGGNDQEKQRPEGAAHEQSVAA